jgi:hypothetical protein
MANLAELYIRLDPFEASEGEYERLGEQIHEVAIGLALRTYGGDVTVEVTITEGSAKIKTTVWRTLLVLDLIYGHAADWKSFKEQVASIYESTSTFLKTMAEEVPKIAHVSPRQVKRLDKRYKASGKLKELVDSVDMLRQPGLEGSSQQPLLKKIQQLAIEAERDLTDNERNKLTSLVSEEVPDIDDLPSMVMGTKLAVLPAAPKLPAPPGPTAVPPKPKRGRSRVVFRKKTQIPPSRRQLR